MREAIAAGFYNIDIDTSTLVDLEQADARRAAAAQLRGRHRHPEGGSRASSRRASRSRSAARSARSARRTRTVEELRAYMDGFNAALPARHGGLSKISVQTGTSHGGVVLADGSIADVKLDLDTLERLSQGRARRIRTGRRGAARRVDAAGHRVQQLPEARDGRDPSRDELPEHAVRPHPGRAARRDVRVAPREREGRAEGDGHRTSSSSTRRARRRSGRSSGSSGTCRPT